MRWLPRAFIAFVALALPAEAYGSAKKVSYRVLKKYSHETKCFTEGLFLTETGNEVFESCGLYGRSYLRRYNLHTGATLQTARVPPQLFSEGLSVLEGRLYMLTYQSRQILEFNATTFSLTTRHPFPFGEGWGLTTDGCDLLATTGSSFIYRLRREGNALRLVNSVQVTHRGVPMKMLNEVEYVTPKLWVNEWLTNRVWRVDPITGVAEVHISVKGLHAWRGEATPNGIAYSTALGREQLIVTGKQWPYMFGLHMPMLDLCGGPAKQPQCAKAPPSACWAGSAGAAGADPAVPATISKGQTPSGKEQQGPGIPAATSAAISAVEAKPKDPAAPAQLVPPLPPAFTVVSVLLAVVVAVSAVAVPLCISSRRQPYRMAAQNAERDVSL